MKIFVTGGCGYVGSVLVPKLLNRGDKVTCFDAQWFGKNLEDHENLEFIKDDIRNIRNHSLKGYDSIIHLANIANDPCGDLDSKLAWEVNVLSGMQLVEQAIEANIDDLVFASSGSVYGVQEAERVTEDLDLVPISDYNKTKMICERVLLSYQDRINLKIVRPATVCGFSPRTRFDVSVNMFTTQAMINEKITLFGGDQVRPNIHVQDLTDVFLHLVDSKEIKGVFNAGFENIALKDMVGMIKSEIPCEVIVTESNDPRSYRLCSDKLLATGFKPKYSVADAVRELKGAFRDRQLEMTDNNFNIKTMQKLISEGKI